MASLLGHGAQQDRFRSMAVKGGEQVDKLLAGEGADRAAATSPPTFQGFRQHPYDQLKTVGFLSVTFGILGTRTL